MVLSGVRACRPDKVPAVSVQTGNVAQQRMPARPIRRAGVEETEVYTISALGKTTSGGTLRCVPHPCWSRDGKRVWFNGAPDGTRQVFIVDLEGLL